MAGPVSHVVFAQKALANFVHGKDPEQFIVGTLFPDIQYLGVINRQSTHFGPLALEDVVGEKDSFKSGMLFHSVIDRTREKSVKAHGAYWDLPRQHLTTVALKVCEDLELYSLVQNWPECIQYLATIRPQEKEFGIPLDKIQAWHSMHQEYFASASLLEDKQFFYSLGFTTSQVSELYTLVDRIRAHCMTDKYLSAYEDNLHELLEVGA